ncbi:MAG: hypothetical protein IJ518_00255 [Clostridia bacterium]|nr:hypothetical protein [Clostridia bacterium]
MNPSEQEPIIATTEPEVPVSEPDIAPPETDVTDRLAADFLQLTEEFPALQSPAQLPDAVLDMAAEEAIPLLDAYLRYRWQEEKKVQAATRQAEEAARRSAGSLSAGAQQAPPEQDAFLRAFRRAL